MQRGSKQGIPIYFWHQAFQLPPRQSHALAQVDEQGLELGQLKAQIAAKDETIKQLRNSTAGGATPQGSNPWRSGFLTGGMPLLSPRAAAAQAQVTATLSDTGMASTLGAEEEGGDADGMAGFTMTRSGLQPHALDAKIADLEDELQHSRTAAEMQLGTLAKTNAKLIVQVRGEQGGAVGAVRSVGGGNSLFRSRRTFVCFDCPVLCGV